MQLVGVLFLVFLGFFQHQDCSCLKVADEEITHYGHTHSVVIEEETTNLLQGRVLLNGDENESMPDVLVEVFDDPDVLLEPNSDEKQEREKKRRRLAACKTSKDGDFCFGKLPSGRYELRCSRKEFNSISLIVEVDRNQNSANKIIKVPLHVAN